MRLFLTTLFFSWTLLAHAQTEPPAARLSSAQIHWSPLSTWIPSKKGLALGRRINEKWLLETEYTSGSLSATFWSLDFGGLTDRRYGIQGRYFPSSGSFHWIFGLFKSEFRAELGSSLLSGTPLTSTNIWSFESYGPQLGMGHRWDWDSGFSLGMDWLVIYTPLFGTTDDSALRNVANAEDRSDLDKALGNVRKLPQFELLKLNLGYRF